MKILSTEIYKFSIPMHPFTISTGTMHFAQNIFIRVHTDAGFYGVGECSAFPMIVGETQATCFEMAKEFGAIWRGKDSADIEQRMQELHDFTSGNTTIKSAFDMAIYDLAAKASNVPLYVFLGGSRKEMETDLTIGISTPQQMADTAVEFKRRGVTMIKIKLGKNGEEDVQRVRLIRQAIGDDTVLRVDANQGWDFETAKIALMKMKPYNVQFCEQPMRSWNDHRLPELITSCPIKIMADESIYDHHDAERLIDAKACDYVNIKFAKSGGILEANKIIDVCKRSAIVCMMGGMLESRIALTAFAHFAMANDTIKFYDMDTCMLGHKVDPVTGGVKYRGYFVEPPDVPGIGADADNAFLSTCASVRI